jgi:anti-sigma factor RsiW
MDDVGLDRDVGGIRCREVLTGLSAYLDGELPAADRARVDAHLRACDRCERFGGAFGAVVGALRRELADPPPLEDGVARRLRTRLAESG